MDRVPAELALPAQLVDIFLEVLEALDRHASEPARRPGRQAVSAAIPVDCPRARFSREAKEI